MDSGLVCLAMVAGFHGRATNPDRPSHDLAHSPPADADAILRAAKRLELKAKLRTLDLGRAAYGKTALSIVEFGSGGFAVGTPHGALMQIDGRRIQLTRGMAVTADIATAKRRVIELFLNPIRRNINQGLRER